MADNDIDASIDLEPAGGAPTLPEAGNQNEEAEESDEEALASSEDEDAEDSGETDDEQDSEPEETWEFEDDTKQKRKVPAWLKPYVLRQSDYSRNMNSLKEQEQSIAAAKEEATKWREAEEAVQRNLGHIAHLDHQLKNFAQGANGQMVSVDQIDWEAWQRQAPQQAQQALLRLNALNQQKQGLSKQIDESKAKYETETKQKAAERLRATREFAEREIPNWSDDRNKAIMDLVDGQGISASAQKKLIEAFEPGVLKLLDLALDGHRYRDARAKKLQQAKVEKKEKVVPLTTVATKRSTGSKPDLRDNLTTAEWIKRRNQQLNANTG